MTFDVLLHAAYDRFAVPTLRAEVADQIHGVDYESTDDVPTLFDALREIDDADDDGRQKLNRSARKALWRIWIAVGVAVPLNPATVELSGRTARPAKPWFRLDGRKWDFAGWPARPGNADPAE